MSESAIQFPKPDHTRMAFQAWAAHYFDEDLRYPLRRADRHDGYYHRSVNAAWEAWKVCGAHVQQENDRLRKLLEEISRHTLNVQIVTEPGKPV